MHCNARETGGGSEEKQRHGNGPRLPTSLTTWSWPNGAARSCVCHPAPGSTIADHSRERAFWNAKSTRVLQSSSRPIRPRNRGSQESRRCPLTRRHAGVRALARADPRGRGGRLLLESAVDLCVRVCWQTEKENERFRYFFLLFAAAPHTRSHFWVVSRFFRAVSLFLHSSLTSKRFNLIANKIRSPFNARVAVG